MLESDTDLTNYSENFSIKKGGMFATLVLPLCVALILSFALFKGFPQLIQANVANDNLIADTANVSNFTAIVAISLFTLPIILALSWGMVFSFKKVSQELKTASKYKKIKFRTVIRHWLATLSMAHMIYVSFYMALGVTFLIISIFFVPNETILAISETAGILGQIGAVIIFGIMVIVYVLLFGLMAYVLVTLPLIFISAILFNLFAVKRSPT